MFTNRSLVRLKRANGRGQTLKLVSQRITSRIPPAAPRATAQSPATASSSALTVEQLNEAGRCAGEGVRCKRRSAQPNDSRKLRCWGFMMQSPQPEALVRRRDTGAYVPHGTTDRGKAKRHEPPPSHRLTVPHSLSFTTSAKRGLQ